MILELLAALVLGVVGIVPLAIVYTVGFALAHLISTVLDGLTNRRNQP